MKSSMLKPGVIVFSFCLLAGCNNSSKEKRVSNHADTTTATGDTATTHTATAQEPPAGKGISSSDNKTDYSFDTISMITGSITTEVFYGSPGFGENPKTDEKEKRYLLVLEKPVNFNGLNVSEEDAEDESRRTRKNVSKIQLLYEDSIDMGRHLGSTVRLTGTFFGAHTGHHHTEVLMDVQKVED